jgi:hypothetical protein
MMINIQYINNDNHRLEIFLSKSGNTLRFDHILPKIGEFHCSVPSANSFTVEKNSKGKSSVKISMVSGDMGGCNSESHKTIKVALRKGALVVAELSEGSAYFSIADPSPTIEYKAQFSNSNWYGAFEYDELYDGRTDYGVKAKLFLERSCQLSLKDYNKAGAQAPACVDVLVKKFDSFFIVD